MTHHHPASRSILSGLLLASILVVVGIAPALAAPNNANTYTVEATCPAVGGTLTMIVVNPNSSGRHLEGTNGVLVLASIVGDVTIDGVTFPLDASAPAARIAHQELTTCFINDTFTVPQSGLTATVDVTIQVILTPRS